MEKTIVYRVSFPQLLLGEGPYPCDANGAAELDAIVRDYYDKGADIRMMQDLNIRVVAVKLGQPKEAK